jgi:hypothetical protein
MRTYIKIYIHTTHEFYPRKVNRDIPETYVYQNDLAMENTAGVIGGKPIAANHHHHHHHQPTTVHCWT